MKLRFHTHISQVFYKSFKTFIKTQLYLKDFMYFCELIEITIKNTIYILFICLENLCYYFGCCSFGRLHHHGHKPAA
jgi:hypothetical protein